MSRRSIIARVCCETLRTKRFWGISVRSPNRCGRCATTSPKQTNYAANTRKSAGSWKPWTSIRAPSGGLARDLTLADLRSRGFLALREYLTCYTKSPAFASLAAETQKLKADLAAVRYCLHIKGKRIRVSRYDSEPDYGTDVLRTFEKFKQGSAARSTASTSAPSRT